jgi:hypothetical protein
MQTLAELRKQLKPLGFTVTTKIQSHGPHATYKHIETKELLTFNVFTPEKLAKWKPLLDWKKENAQALKELREELGIYGLL